MTRAMAGVIHPQMDGSPSSQLHVYMQVSKMTRPQAQVLSRPRVPVRTASAP